MRLLYQAVALGFTVYILHRVSVSLKRRQRAKAQGCGAPRQKIAEPLITRLAKFRDIFNSSKSFSDYEQLRSLYRQYGHTFTDVSVTGRKIIRTIDEKNIQTIYGTDAAEWLVGPMRWSGMHEFMGNGFITTDGPLWQRSRNLLKPSFHKDIISDLTTFEGHVSKMISKIPKDGSTVDLQPLLVRMFYDTSSEFLLGEPIGALTQTTTAGSTFWQAFQLSMRGCGLKLFAGPFKGLIPKRLTTEQFNIVHRVIDARVQQVMQEKSEKTSHPRRGLLYDLIQQTSDPIEIRNQLINALAAAQDTTPTLISNCIFLLSRNPELWNQVRVEATDLGLSPMKAEDTKNLKLIRNILLETLRLYPLFPNLGRMSQTDTVLPVGGGADGSLPIYIPAGTRVMSDFHALHRLESIYGPEPNTFDPGRWNRIEPGAWSYMAFGGGPKSCLGQNKALAEASCVVVRMAQQFRRVESRDDRDWTGSQGLISRNANGCHVALMVA